MRILDITELLNEQNIGHNYNFNPSIAQFNETNIYVVTYRHVTYRITDGNQYECYQIWWQPEILLRQELDDIVDRSLDCKYRKNGLTTETIQFFIGNLPPNNLYFDGTGLLVFELIDDKILPKYHVPNLFPNEYNQDTRIQYNGSDNSFTLTYNIFEDNLTQSIHMVTRKLFIDLQSGLIELSPESYMLTAEHRIVEKNCVYVNSDVLYEINKNFTIYEYHPEGQIIKKKY